jgi:hypothetical protein
MRQYSNLTNGLTHFAPLRPDSVALGNQPLTPRSRCQMPVVTDFLGLAAYHLTGAQSFAKQGWAQCDFVKLGAHSPQGAKAR